MQFFQDLCQESWRPETHCRGSRHLQKTVGPGPPLPPSWREGTWLCILASFSSLGVRFGGTEDGGCAIPTLGIHLLATHPLRDLNKEKTACENIPGRGFSS